MKEVYPYIQKEEINGEEYVTLKDDLFFQLFMNWAESNNIDQDLIFEAERQYKKAKSHKKKRIRMKKMKQVLTGIYHILVSTIEKGSETSEQT